MKKHMRKSENDIQKTAFPKAGQALIDTIQKAEKVNIHKIDRSLEELNDRYRIQSRRRKLWLYTISSAASLLIAVLSISFLYFSGSFGQNELKMSLLNDNIAQQSKEITLITPNDRINLSNESSLEYKKDGKLQVNKEVITKEVPVDNADNKAKINHIVVPKGKRATITFSDGTSMYINSGSHVIYPSDFGKDKREILVEGEVYLEVAKDPTRPFFVKTKKFDVKVLGTTFNVSAYNDDEIASVVLVEGKVEVNNNSLKTTISPNEKIAITNGSSRVSTVNVDEYISWKDYVMLLAEHQAADVFKRLSRYYGVQIECEQPIASYPVSGKLDLRSGINNSLDILADLLDIKYKTTPDGNIRFFQ